MKTLSFLYGYLILLLILSSCNKMPQQSMAEFDKAFPTKRIHYNQLLSDKLILGQPFLINYIDSSLLIYDNIADSLFSLMSLKNESKYQIWSFGRRGQGDNEFLQVFSVARMKEDSLVGIYDCFKHELVQLNLEEIKKGKEVYRRIKKDDILSNKIYPTCYNNFVGIGFYEKNMFSLSDTTKLINYFYEYPFKDKSEHAIPNRLRGLAYQGTLSQNRSLDKFVYAVRSAPIFSLYKVDKMHIEETYQFIGGYPEYKPEENGNEMSAPISSKSKVSFIGSYGTDSYVYLLYSGKSIAEAKTDAFKGSCIYRLKWDGTPDCKFVLDTSITNFCVDDTDRNIYAITEMEDWSVVRFSLN